MADIAITAAGTGSVAASGAAGADGDRRDTDDRDAFNDVSDGDDPSTPPPATGSVRRAAKLIADAAKIKQDCIAAPPVVIPMPSPKLIGDADKIKKGWLLLDASPVTIAARSKETDRLGYVIATHRNGRGGKVKLFITTVTVDTWATNHGFRLPMFGADLAITEVTGDVVTRYWRTIIEKDVGSKKVLEQGGLTMNEAVATKRRELQDRADHTEARRVQRDAEASAAAAAEKPPVRVSRPLLRGAAAVAVAAAAARRAAATTAPDPPASKRPRLQSPEKQTVVAPQTAPVSTQQSEMTILATWQAAQNAAMFQQMQWQSQQNTHQATMAAIQSGSTVQPLNLQPSGFSFAAGPMPVWLPK